MGNTKIDSDTKTTRRAAIYAAMEALYDEILDHERALAALELVYFGTPRKDRSAKPAAEAKKEPRGSAPPKRKGPGKGRGRKKLSQTPAAKLARAYREKKKAEAAAAAGSPAAIPAKIGAPQPAAEPGEAHSAHQVLKDQSEAGAIRESLAEGRPGNALVDRRHRKPVTPAEQKEHSRRNGGNPGRKPTLPPVKSGSLTGLTQQDAIRAVLGNAARQLRSDEILARLLAGGFHFKSSNPRSALSVTLSTMRASLNTETRAGRVFYDPIKRAPEGGEE